MKVFIVEMKEEYDSGQGIQKIFLNEDKAKKYVDDNNKLYTIQDKLNKETHWEITKIQQEFLKTNPRTEMPKLYVLIAEYMDTLNYPEEIKLTNITYCIGKNKSNEYKTYEELQMYEMEVEE